MASECVHGSASLVSGMWQCFMLRGGMQCGWQRACSAPLKLSHAPPPPHTHLPLCSGGKGAGGKGGVNALTLDNYSEHMQVCLVAGAGV